MAFINKPPAKYLFLKKYFKIAMASTYNLNFFFKSNIKIIVMVIWPLKLLKKCKKNYYNLQKKLTLNF